MNSVITNRVIYETQERVKEALNAARWLYEAKINDIDRTIHLTSIRYEVKRTLDTEKASRIKDDMKRLMAEYGLDFLTLVNQKGTVLFRFHHPGFSGDSLIEDPFIREALKNRSISGTQVLLGRELLKEGKALAERAVFFLIPTPREKPTEEVEGTSGMVLKSAHPIIDANGKVLGALMGGILLNRHDEIVDRIQYILFKDAKYHGKEIGTAAIFLGDLIISTNIIDRESNRANGTRVSEEVYEQVFAKGFRWINRAYVVDDWYITAYEPIRDIHDKIVGMLYVGILESKYVMLKEKLVLLFMFGMLITVAISSALSFKILKKELLENIHSGQKKKA